MVQAESPPNPLQPPSLNEAIEHQLEKVFQLAPAVLKAWREDKRKVFGYPREGAGK